MKIYIASDHGGYKLKQGLIQYLKNSNYNVEDLGTNDEQSVDYPDYAEKIAESITRGQAERGIILCGSGVGACIAANKIKGIYAAVCHDTYSAHQGVEHDNMNVLCLGARIVGAELAMELVQAFLAAKFSSDVERHVRRVNKIYRLEKNANE